MPNEPTRPKFPDAIYFDTNALRQAGFAFDHSWFTELHAFSREFDIRLVIPKLVWDEYIRYVTESYETVMQKIENHQRLLNDLSWQVVKVEVQKIDLAAALADRVEILAGAGFEFIETTELLLRDLLTQAVNHVPPFGEKGGFRDTVIVESIAAHAVATFGNPTVLIVSSDTDVATGLPRFIGKGIDARVLKPQEASNFLSKRKGEIIGHVVQHGDPQLNDLVRGNQDFIFDQVRKAKIDIYHIEGGLLRGKDDPLADATVRKVLSAAPTALGPALPWGGLGYAELIPQGRDPISFHVDVEFRLVVSRRAFGGWFFGGPSVPLDSPTDIDHSKRWSSSWAEQEETVTRSIPVLASVLKDDGPPHGYSDLQLHRVG